MKSATIMNKGTTAILSASPMAEDHKALNDILRQHSASGHHHERWKLLTSSSLERATKLLRQDEIPLAICERDLPGQRTWKDLLDQSAEMSHNPLVIVTSRLADERLWAEVLNLGGWDVLTKPFDGKEVLRVVHAAWRHWQNQHEQRFAEARQLASSRA